MPSPDFEAALPRHADPTPCAWYEPFVEALVAGVPEFLPHYLDLVEACDDDPGPAALLVALADFVGDRLAAVEAARPAVEAVLALIEQLVADLPDPDRDAELVALAFFDSFTAEDRRRLGPAIGPCSTVVLETLDMPDGRADRPGPGADRSPPTSSRRGTHRD